MLQNIPYTMYMTSTKLFPKSLFLLGLGGMALLLLVYIHKFSKYGISFGSQWFIVMTREASSEW